MQTFQKYQQYIICIKGLTRFQNSESLLYCTKNLSTSWNTENVNFSLRGLICRDGIYYCMYRNENFFKNKLSILISTVFQSSDLGKFTPKMEHIFEINLWSQSKSHTKVSSIILVKLNYFTLNVYYPAQALYFSRCSVKLSHYGSFLQALKTWVTGYL